MNTRETIILITLALAVAVPSALAQEEEDPTVNESDFNTTEPESDESYLDEAEQESAEDPTLTESDFDTTAPTADESYLDDAESEIGADGSGGSATGSATPGLPLVGALAALAVAGLALRRR
jgi:LPXTG-motif cell wall-anchored protein